jgi:hypothetical protein
LLASDYFFLYDNKEEDLLWTLPYLKP